VKNSRDLSRKTRVAKRKRKREEEKRKKNQKGEDNESKEGGRKVGDLE